MVDEISRVRIIEKSFGRKSASPTYVDRRVRLAIRRKQGLSVIRLGDVMAKLLSRQMVDSLKGIALFLGVPLPLPTTFYNALDYLVRRADIVGMSHFTGSIRKLKVYMRQKNWRPPCMTDAFINDQLYQTGKLHKLIRDYRVALVGRAAPQAAMQLRRRGYKVALTVDLNSHREISRAFKILRRSVGRYDLVLVGASVPGRILCVKTALQLKKVGIEIGHIMDALANPREWKNLDSRRKFKHRWLRKLRKKK